jgi:hypothetical protein
MTALTMPPARQAGRPEPVSAAFDPAAPAPAFKAPVTPAPASADDLIVRARDLQAEFLHTLLRRAAGGAGRRLARLFAPAPDTGRRMPPLGSGAR